VRILVAAVATLALASCTSVDSSVDSGCTSSHLRVARADTWTELREAMTAYDAGRGRTTGIRVQERGHDLSPDHGGVDVVRVVDLLDRRDRRLLQVDVWRTDDGGWAAGAWQQCID
jgi:hypothetical protein